MLLSMTVVDRRIGSAPFVCEGSPVQGIARAAELGYDGVELHFTDPAQADAAGIAAALKKTGLCLTALGTGRAYVNEGLSITDPDETRRSAAISRLREFIDLAGQFNAKVIIGCMRGNISSDAELPAALERLARSMTELDRYAGERCVEIVFEPINRYENNFLCSMEEISRFIRENSLKHTGLLIDTFHMNIEEADLSRSIRMCAPEIRYVHLADSNRCYPGAGHSDLRGVINTLKQIGYRGTISAEILPWPTGDEAAARWLASTRNLLKDSSL